MRAHTKKRHTEKMSEIRFIGPTEKISSAIEALSSLGFTSVSDSVPWEECFPEYTSAQLPGVALAGARSRLNMTQKNLSELTGIPQRHISEMERGKRPIGKESAKKFGAALNISYKVFL